MRWSTPLKKGLATLLSISLHKQWDEIQSSPIFLRLHFSCLLQLTVIPLTLRLYTCCFCNFGALSHLFLLPYMSILQLRNLSLPSSSALVNSYLKTSLVKNSYFPFLYTHNTSFILFLYAFPTGFSTTSDLKRDNIKHNNVHKHLAQFLHMIPLDLARYLMPDQYSVNVCFSEFNWYLKFWKHCIATYGLSYKMHTSYALSYLFCLLRSFNFMLLFPPPK